MVSDDVTHRATVDGKQQRPEHRPLRNADLELHDWWLMPTLFY